MVRLLDEFEICMDGKPAKIALLLNHVLRLVRGACNFKTYLNPTLSKAPKKETDFLRPQRESRDTGEQNRHENPITRSNGTVGRPSLSSVSFFLSLLQEILTYESG